MNTYFTVRKMHGKREPEYDVPKTPEERLDLLEILRLEAGKFLYEYPARLRRTVKVIRKKSSGRLQDKADAQNLED